MKKRLLLILAAAITMSCSNNTTDKLGAAASDVIIPIPNNIAVGTKSISLSNGVKINTTNADELAQYLTSKLEVEEVATDGVVAINITVDSSATIEEQGYKLIVNERGVDILASDEAGAFYGAQTLLQIITEVEGEKVVLFQSIDDAPRFKWRSYMLDEARHFYGMDYIYRTLDNMADMKLNVLHWHLTDDAGWRIEIKQYPLLTQIGSKRKDTESGTWGSGKTAGKPHEGFYTQEQIRDVVAYAKARHIKIVPEIEMPGHASASVAAYPWLATKNQKIEVPTTFGKHYFIYDVINPDVITFLENVIVEVIDLFDADVVHIGGDEVRFNQWEEDAEMQAHKKKMGYDSYMDIQIEFTNIMSHFIENQGCSMMGWNEILGTNHHVEDEIIYSDISGDVAKSAIVQFWKGDVKSISEAAASGYKLVNSFHRYTYLDYSYSIVPLSKAYSFEPIPEDLDEQYHDNIIGIGCQMWTEWRPTAADAEWMTYPRIAAYAEVGWSQPQVKDYDGFLTRLGPVMESWKANGFNVCPLEEADIEEYIPAK